MSYQTALESRDFDTYVSLSEKAAREAAVASNNAFAAAMAREKVKPGTFVDRSHFYGAKRFYGEARSSACGSPAAMCMETGGAQAGAESLK